MYLFIYIIEKRSVPTSLHMCKVNKFLMYLPISQLNFRYNICTYTLNATAHNKNYTVHELPQININNFIQINGVRTIYLISHSHIHVETNVLLMMLSGGSFSSSTL